MKVEAPLIGRVFSEGESFELDSGSDLPDLEDIVVACLQPAMLERPKAAWNNRTPLLDKVRPPSQRKSHLGHIVLSVIPNPYDALLAADEDPKVLVQPSDGIVTDRRARLIEADIPVLGPQSVGFNFRANTLSLGGNPTGELDTSIWYSLATPKRRYIVIGGEHKPLDAASLIAASGVVRNVARPTFRRFDRDELVSHRGKAMQAPGMGLLAIKAKLLEETSETKRTH